jgi:hypothetical protein
MLMEWLREKDNGVSGICFSSSRAKAYHGDYLLSANFAFPSRNICPSGYCSLLAESFEFSEPQHWLALELMEPEAIHDLRPLTYDTQYNAAAFAKFEGRVHHFDRTKISHLVGR